jgi:hypothetical protein
MRTVRLRLSVSVVLLSALVLLSAGCGEDDGDRLTSDGPPTGTPTYTEDIEPLLQASCSCHQPGGSKYADVPLDTYDKVFDRRERIKQRAGVEGTMPPAGALDAEARQLIITWVDEGAPE